ncbi:MAG: DNA-binding response regulator [Acidobacteria bacterium]|nr:MAG: DNA-binding response regulator [Acidobacteriota bacterium]
MKPQPVKVTVRVLLADDHDVVRKGVRTMLEGREGWQVCGEASTGTEAVRLAAQLQPDIAVLDLEMAELDGLQATRLIKKDQPQIEVLIFTMHDTEYLIREVLSAGARAFVLKSEGGRALIEAIESVSRHKPFFAARASETLLNSFLKSTAHSNEPSPLTDREREVVQLLSAGQSNKQVAAALGISVKTVETHRAAVMRKLGFSSIVELVRYAVRERLIKP